MGGGAGIGRSFSLGIRPPAEPKGPPFILFWDIHFWLIDLKIFLKAPLAPIEANFEGGARAEKTREEIFQKVHNLKKLPPREIPRPAPEYSSSIGTFTLKGQV